MIPMLAGLMGGGGGGGGASTLTSGLLMWHDLEEASGTRVAAFGGYDLSPTGSVGRAAMRNGYGSSAPVGAYLSRGTSPNLATGDFTIAGVFRSTQANAGIVSRQSASGSTTARQYLVTLDSGALFLSVSTSGLSNAAVVGSGAGLNDGALHDFIAWRDTAASQICLQVDGGTIYTSGGLSGSAALYSATDPGLFLHSIGAEIYTGGADIDSLGIWGRMLTTTERATLRNSGAWRSFAEL